MSAEATGFVIRHSPFKGATYTVHLCVADSVNDQNGNEFFMSIANLATKARCERRTAGRAVDELVADGWLKVLTAPLAVVGKPTGVPGRYRFLFPDDRDVVFESRRGGGSSGPTSYPQGGSTRPTGGSREPTPGGSREPTGRVVTTHQAGRENPGGGSTEPTNPREPKGNPTHPSAGSAAASEDALVVVLLEEISGSTSTTELDAARYRKAARDLVAVGASIHDVVAAVAKFRELWPAMTVTPIAIATHWSLLAAAGHPDIATPRSNPDCESCSGSGWDVDDNGYAIPCTCTAPPEEATR